MALMLAVPGQSAPQTDDEGEPGLLVIDADPGNHPAPLNIHTENGTHLVFDAGCADCLFDARTTLIELKTQRLLPDAPTPFVVNFLTGETDRVQFEVNSPPDADTYYGVQVAVDIVSAPDEITEVVTQVIRRSEVIFVKATPDGHVVRVPQADALCGQGLAVCERDDEGTLTGLALDTSDAVIVTTGDDEADATDVGGAP